MLRISTRTHGIIDLLFASAFIASPFILKVIEDNNKVSGGRKAKKRKKKNIVIDNIALEEILLPAIGAGILAQGIVSNHELGVSKIINMKLHIVMDIARGSFLIAAPMLLNLDKKLRIPMAVMGALEIGHAIMTEHETSYEELEAILDDPDEFIEEISHIL
jgi:hypothetical protein